MALSGWELLEMGSWTADWMAYGRRARQDRAVADLVCGGGGGGEGGGGEGGGGEGSATRLRYIVPEQMNLTNALLDLNNDSALLPAATAWATSVVHFSTARATSVVQSAACTPKLGAKFQEDSTSISRISLRLRRRQRPDSLRHSPTWESHVQSNPRKDCTRKD